MKNNSKFKKSRIVVPALALAVLTTTAAATSTVAWFSANSTVHANGLSSTAVVNSANLFIAHSAGVTIENLTSTADVTLGETTATPNALQVADIDASGNVQIPATYDSEPTVDKAGKAATWTKVGAVTASTASSESGYTVGNFIAYDFITIGRKQTNAGSYKLTPSVKVTFATATKLNGAVRAGLYINNAWHATTTDLSGDSIGTEEQTLAFADITGLSDNVAYSACLVFWFEGEDEDCTVNNGVTVSKDTANWTFTAADAE